MKNNKFFVKALTLCSTLALAVTSFNISTTCLFTVHQPKLPTDAKKLRKF